MLTALPPPPPHHVSQALRSAPTVTLDAFVLQLSNVPPHELKGMVDTFQHEIALIRNFVGSSPEIHAPALVLELLFRCVVVFFVFF